MFKLLHQILILALFIASLDTVLLAENNPQVKKSKSGICHPVGGTYYDKTKNFTSYPSMEACIKSGGRPAKR